MRPREREQTDSKRICAKGRACTCTRQGTATHTTTIHTAMHCNALQCTAMHCNALQCTAPRCQWQLVHTSHCNTLQCTAMHCNALQCTATRCQWQLVHTSHCNALQCTATRLATRCQWLANGLPMATVMAATVLATATTKNRVWAREQESERASKCMRELVSAYYKPIVKNLTSPGMGEGGDWWS